VLVVTGRFRGNAKRDGDHLDVSAETLRRVRCDRCFPAARVFNGTKRQ